MPVNVVLGAGGGVGLECVKQLVSAARAGDKVRAVVRDPEKYAKSQNFPQSDKLEVVRGDVTDTASLRQCLQNASGAIYAASGRGYWSANSVDHEGVAKVAQAAKEAGTKRVVLVSSCLVTHQHRFHPVRIMLNNLRWGLMDAKLKGEEALRKSGVDYTVVRPGGLADGPAGKAELQLGQGDKLLGRVNRADVAAVCIAALTAPKTRNATLELASKESSAAPALPEQLSRLFDSMQPDAELLAGGMKSNFT